MDVGRRSESVLLPLAAGATAAILGTITIERRPLWLDEAFDVMWTRLSWPDFVQVAFHREGSQALYLFVLKPWLDTTSDDEWIARAPSVLFAALAAASLVVLATRLFDSRWVGLGAGLLLATNVVSVSWSQQARQYSLAMLLSIVVTYLLVVALESETWRWWLVYGVVAGVSVYAHFFVALVLASHFLAVASTLRTDVVKKWSGAAAIAFVIALPAVNFTLNHDNGQVSWIPELSYAYVKSVLHQATGSSWLALGLGALALLVLAFEIGRAARDAWRYVIVASWLVVPLALALVISSFKPMLVERYLIVSLPALVLAIAYAVFRLGHRAGTVVLIGLVVVSLAHVRDWYDSFIPQDWRGAVRYVERTRTTSEPVLVQPGFLASPVDYYADVAIDSTGTLETDGAWIVTLGERGAEIEQLVAESGYEVSERRGFANVEVWHVVRAAG